MALEIDTMQKSRKTLEAEHEARLTTEKQQQTRLKFEWGVKLSKYEKKAIEDAEHLATAVASSALTLTLRLSRPLSPTLTPTPAITLTRWPPLAGWYSPSMTSSEMQTSSH